MRKVHKDARQEVSLRYTRKQVTDPGLESMFVSHRLDIMTEISSFLPNNLSDYGLLPPLQLHRLQSHVQPLGNFIKFANINGDY